MPTLLQINSAVNFSSTGKIVEQLGVAARKDGWQTYVAHGARYVKQSELKDLHIESPWEERIHGIKSKLFDAHGLGSTYSTRRLIEEIKKIKPDVIHLHNIHGYYINYPILFNYLGNADIPVMWTFHDCWPITGHCAYFDLANCEKWKTECHDCELRGQYPVAWIDRCAANYAKKKYYFNLPKKMIIVPVSRWEEDVIKESFLKGFRTQVIYSGIDTEVFKPTVSHLREELGLKNQFVILGVASGWGKEGRLNGFLELRKRLSSAYTIILVGLTKEQIGSMPEGIMGVERTNNVQELAAYYTMADIFINPTMQDSFGLTSVEALSCGTPAITYRSGGSPETVDENTGIVVERGNADGLADAVYAIEMVLKNGNLAGLYGKETCRSRAVEHFNKYDRYQDYIDLYNSLIGRK